MPATITVYTTHELLEMVSVGKPPSDFIRSSFFGDDRFSDSKFVEFDIKKGKRRIAPFVAPHVKGRPVKRLGYTTKQIVPAYIKDLRPISPDDTTTRVAGEPFGGTLSRQQRLDALTSEALFDQDEMIRRRISLMCMEILRTSQCVISGEDYPTVTVAFGRDASLSGAMDTPFGDVADNKDPLKEVKAKASIAKKLSGRYPRNLIMSQSVWDQFSIHPLVLKKLDNRGVTGNSIQTATSDDNAGATFMGTYDGFRFWTFEDWYVDENDVEQDVLPADEMIGVADVGGRVLFGAISDFDAGMQALPFYAKSWTDPDPSAMNLLAQSAPLPVMTVPDGCFRLTGCLSEESES